MISWDRLRPKIAECWKEHEGCQHKAQQEHQDLPLDFRVIDVLRRRIIQLNNVPFIALSYVWGTNNRPSLLTATRETISGMKRDGGLPKIAMPQAIEDAMTICTQLGERYLWVDRLCIVQDDSVDKQSQIERMGDIYSTARLVLIVAHGESMDSGIYGVSQPRREIQRYEDISSLRITNVVEESLDDPLALWKTRGWTYQEAVLARRLLHFTNAQAFFECEELTFPEDAYNFQGDFRSYKLHQTRGKSRFKDFALHLTFFTSRSLSYQSDVYNAITGIMKMLYKDDDAFINGLPQVDFDRALLWEPRGGLDGQTNLRHLETDQILCPTWSWSTAMNHLERVSYNREKELYGSLAIWYQINKLPSSADYQLQAVNFHSKTKMDDDWALHMAIACEEGLAENFLPLWSLRKDSFSTIREKAHACWPDYLTFCKERVKSAQSRPWYQRACFVKPIPKPGILLTRTQTGLLRLQDGHSNVCLVDSGGSIIGKICGDVAWLKGEITSPNYDKNTSYEFIALSLSNEWIPHYPPAERHILKFFDVDDKPLDRFLTVNLLMIGWRGQYAHRKALGWAYLKNWVKVDRIWKTVMLE